MKPKEVPTFKRNPHKGFNLRGYILLTDNSGIVKKDDIAVYESGEVMRIDGMAGYSLTFFYKVYRYKGTEEMSEEFL